MTKKPKTKSPLNGNFFQDLVKSSKLADTDLVANGLGSAEFSGFIDTGSFSLNALLSGRLTGGIPNNKVVAFAGLEGVGKTFFVLGVIKQFLDENPDAGVIYYDTEAAVTREMMEQRGIDTARIILHEPVTLQQFRTHAVRFLNAYLETPATDRPPLLMALDSLGGLSTDKEVKDVAEGNETRDMTRASLVRGTFRVLRLKLAAACVPMLITNHVYENVGGYGPKVVMSGGGGLRYAADEIIYLTKKIERDGDFGVGSIITARTYKSRITRDNQFVEVRLHHKTGLDRYYGLEAIATRAGIFTKDGNRIRLPDDRLVYGKAIDENPAEVFDPILDRIQTVVTEQFTYASGFAGAGETKGSE